MNEIEKFFLVRQSLIDQYVKGDMTKAEYLQENLNAVLRIGIKPFQNVDTVEKALYNYQYYNAYAKYMKSRSGEKNISYSRSLDYMDKTEYYYERKDKATMQVLKLLDYKDVEAYFIKVRSKMLAGKLYEILIFEGKTGMILHSTSPYILSRLRSEGVFKEEKKISMIDNYINQKY